MAGQQHPYPSGFPTAQQQAMRTQFGGGQMVSGLMTSQQAGIENPQQFGVGVGANTIGLSNTQQVMAQQQQLAQQTVMQQQMQQMQQPQPGTQLAQSNQGASQVQPSHPPVPSTQSQSQSVPSVPPTESQPQAQPQSQPQEQTAQLAQSNQSASQVQTSHPPLPSAQSQSQVVSSVASTQSQSQSQSQEQSSQLSQSGQNTNQVPASHTPVPPSQSQSQSVPSVPPSQSQPQEQSSQLTQSSQSTNQVQTPHSSVPPTQTVPSVPSTQTQNQSQPQSQPQQQNKEFNTVSLCKFGQETVQEIVSRTLEVFQTLKVLQPPNGTSQGATMANEKKAKVQDQLRMVKMLFRRLRIIYEKCNENCQLQGMEYTHIESLIPLKEEWDMKSDEKKTSEAYRLACEESKEVMEQVISKNRHLKEIIDHLRRIISEINTMLNMRRS